MFEKRYRSHHDAGYALKSYIEQIEESGPVPEERLEKLLHSRPCSDDRAVYVHVPYCDRLCSFCNMRRELCKDNLSHYTNHLLKEFEKYGSYPYIKIKPFKVVYFGGGTPTVFSETQLENILKSIHINIPLSKDCEFTFETTLHNLTDEKIEIMQCYGVNRISVGIQTFSDRGRKLLGRTFDGKEAEKRLKNIRNRFNGILGVDIIYSYPDESDDEILNDADKCRALGIESVSFYSLMLLEGSVLDTKIKSGSLKFDRSIETDRHIHNLFLKRMMDNKYEILELSKLVQPATDEYRYIRMRYNNTDLLPVGTGAGGRIGSIGIYKMHLHRIMLNEVSEIQNRYNRLLGIMQFGLYNIEVMINLLPAECSRLLELEIDNLVHKGYMKAMKPGVFKLTDDGIFWGNNIAVLMLEKLIKHEFPWIKNVA